MKTLTISLCLALFLSGCGSNVSVTANAPPPIADTPPMPVTVPPNDPPPPPVVPVVDDTAEIQARLDLGGVVQLDARTYHLTRTLMVWQSGTTLQGKGDATVIEFSPTEPRKHCTTDRVITTRCALSSTAPLGVAGPIRVGDTSFTVINADDAANLGAGDWVLIGSWDPGILDGVTHTAYVTTVDWVQVASVSGATVTVTEPFRQEFVNLFPYKSTAGNTAIGLTFQKILVTRDITVQSLKIVVADGIGAAGVCVLSTLNANVNHVTVITKASQPLYSEYSKGATFDSNTVTGGNTLSEFATSVDLTISNNSFSAAAAPGIGLDLGTGYFTVTGNTLHASANAGIYALYHVHDGVISGNVLDKVITVGGAARSIGILLEGSPDIKVTGNTLLGGVGATSVGILFAPFSRAQLPETAAGDVQSGNTISGFNTAVQQ